MKWALLKFEIDNEERIEMRKDIPTKAIDF